MIDCDFWYIQYVNWEPEVLIKVRNIFHNYIVCSY